MRAHFFLTMLIVFLIAYWAGRKYPTALSFLPIVGK